MVWSNDADADADADASEHTIAPEWSFFRVIGMFSIIVEISVCMYYIRSTSQKKQPLALIIFASGG